MSVQALTCAFAVKKISSSEKLVLLALANYANDRMQCWPSQERLSADTELSERTIWAALKGLETKLMLSRQSRKRSDGTRSTDVFTLHFHGLVTADPLANLAKPSRNSCETQSQILPTPVAAIATLNLSEDKPPVGEPERGADAPPAPKKSRRMPASWSPSIEDLEVGAEEGFTPGELARALAIMRDHQFRDAHTDWSAVYRNWIRQDASRTRPQNGQRPHPLQSAQANGRAARRGVWAEVLAEENGDPTGLGP